MGEEEEDTFKSLSMMMIALDIPLLFKIYDSLPRFPFVAVGLFVSSCKRSAFFFLKDCNEVGTSFD